MLIFLYGQDTYRMRQKLLEIIERYKKIHKSGLNLICFDCEEKGLGEKIFSNLKEETLQTAMFKEKKLIILRDFFSNSSLKEAFLKNKELFLENDNIILFSQKGKVDKKDIFFKFLQKNAKCQEFNFLEGQSLKRWIVKEVKKEGAKITNLALENLVSYVGNDLWQMANEIKKLASFKKKGVIKKEDVQRLVRAKIDSDIFITIEAIAQRDKERALELLHQHLEKGDHPLYILGMIGFQCRNLLIVKELSEKYKNYYVVKKESGLHPFSVKKNFPLAKKFSLDELKRIYQKIFETDLDIKTGKIDPVLALDLLVSQI